MGERSSNQVGPFGAYCVIAIVSGMATLGIAIIAQVIISRWTTFDAAALFAVTLMVAFPAGMGIGISFFVSRTAKEGSHSVDKFE